MHLRKGPREARINGLRPKGFRNLPLDCKWRPRRDAAGPSQRHRGYEGVMRPMLEFRGKGTSSIRGFEMPGTKRVNPMDMHIGQQIRIARLSMGLSQEHLGKALGLTFQQILRNTKMASTACRVHGYRK